MKKVLYFLGTILFCSCTIGGTSGSFQGTFVSTVPGGPWVKIKIDNSNFYYWEVNPNSGYWGDSFLTCSLKSADGKAKISKGYSSIDGSLLYYVETDTCFFKFVFYYFPDNANKYYYQFDANEDYRPVKKVSENYSPWH
jgi:hypothetical protein